MSTTEELGAGILNKSAELCSLMKAAERDVLVIEKMAEHVRSDCTRTANERGGSGRPPIAPRSARP